MNVLLIKHHLAKLERSHSRLFLKQAVEAANSAKSRFCGYGGHLAVRFLLDEIGSVADALAVNEAEYVQSMFDAWGAPPTPDSPEKRYAPPS